MARCCCDDQLRKPSLSSCLLVRQSTANTHGCLHKSEGTESVVWDTALRGPVSSLEKSEDRLLEKCGRCKGGENEMDRIRSLFKK